MASGKISEQSDVIVTAVIEVWEANSKAALGNKLFVTQVSAWL